MIVTYNKTIVVCATDNCVNNGISLEVLTEQSSPVVICGVCGNAISDLTVVGTEDRNE